MGPRKNVVISPTADPLSIAHGGTGAADSATATNNLLAGNTLPASNGSLLTNLDGGNLQAATVTAAKIKSLPAPTVTVKTSGTSYTAIGTVLRLRMWAGGGGGGGSDSVAVSAAAGGGGACGGYEEKIVAVTPGQAYTYAIGAGGTAGAAGSGSGGGTGGDGGDSTFTVGATTYRAKGGHGGVGGVAGTVAGVTQGGLAVATGGTGDFAYGGENGWPGLRFTGLIGAGGGGGSGIGVGGNTKTSDGAGLNASGRAAGGGGALTTNGGTANAGGTGSGGQIVIEDYL